MKKALRNISDTMHRADPTARFAFEFWDGEDVVYGDRPEVLMRLKTKESANHIW